MAEKIQEQTVSAFQDVFSRNQEGKGAVNNVQVNWTLSNTGRIYAQIIVGEVAFDKVEVSFRDLAVGFRPRIGAAVLQQKEALGNLINKGTGSRGSKGFGLKVVQPAGKKAAEA